MSFGSDIRGFQREMREQVGQTVADTAARIYQGVTFRSPVDTGRFRSSWTISWSQPDEAVLPPGAASFIPQTLTAVPPDDFPVAFVNNSLPYGPSLEEGSSAQAPSGMVAVTLAEVEALI